MKKPRTLTRTAASLLLIPLIHLAFLAVSGGLAYLLEFPTNRGVFYVFFAVPAMLLFFTIPFDVLLTAQASIVCGICAMCRGGSKIKNIATIIVSAVLIIFTILLLAEFIPRLLEGMASV
ncbi:MAG: hypothetical protein IJ363_12720 [Clostridia bacterium]|nr:hypothetical protein [Clostridia bacterium]